MGEGTKSGVNRVGPRRKGGGVVSWRAAANTAAGARETRKMDATRRPGRMADERWASVIGLHRAEREGLIAMAQGFVEDRAAVDCVRHLVSNRKHWREQQQLSCRSSVGAGAGARDRRMQE